MDFKEKIAVIGDHDTIAGFALAGVNELISVNSQTCEEAFLKTIGRSEIGVLIIQDDLTRNFSHRTKKAMETLARPVIVAVPGKSEALDGKKSGNIADLVKRAIGIELKA
ncbi:MAG: V-type ATP synthase subunit F [Candidatus Micrarchaeota archaeon]|nr:V-type ATP synthase subunit F [Candidatus Micrarchaeota archaeon]